MAWMVATASPKANNSLKFPFATSSNVGQILMPVLKMNFEEVDELPETIRGSGGFGSTGK